MSDKKKREITLLIVAICVFISPPCLSVSLGKLEDDFGVSKVQKSTAPKWIQLDPRVEHKFLPGGKVTLDQNSQSERTGFKTRRHQLSPFEEEALSRKLEENGIHLTLKGLSWTPGDVRKPQGSTPSQSEKGYRSDFTGFRPVQGEILGVSLDTTRISEWLAMKPLVHCDHNAMTFSASGGGFTNLFVGRDGGSPVSLFDLPSDCGYSVKTIWGVLEIIVPYDACYVIQEDGNIVLPLEWWGSPLKLSCPMRRPVPAPRVYCSHYGMAVQIVGQEADLPTLGFKVNGRWGPLIVEECACLVNSQPGNFLFFISATASCLTIEDAAHLWLIIDELEYTLSCPAFSSIPPSPSEPQFPFFPDPVSPEPTSPPAPTPQYVDPYYLHPQFPQLYTPGPQPPQMPKPTPDIPPGPQLPVYPPVPNTLSYFGGDDIKRFSPQAPALPNYNVAQEVFRFPPKLPDSPDPSNIYYPHAPYPESTPKPLKPNRLHHYPNPYFQIPYDPTPQTNPAPLTPQTLPSEPLGFPLHPLFYPPYTHEFYNAYQFSHQTPLTPSTVFQKFPPPYFRDCFPFGSELCTYYPNHYYHPPQSPLYSPEIMPTIPTIATASPDTMPLVTQHHCLKDRILVFLPFAHPDSIQIKDKENVWVFLSNVSTLCGYDLRESEGPGLILLSPLPGCHTYSRCPTSTSLSLRFWDMYVALYRTEDINCPKQTVTLPPFTPSGAPSPPPSLQPSPYGASKPEVFCSLHHMTVELPAGPISEIILKDLNGNKKKLQNLPKDCEYSASTGKDGKSFLTLPLHLQCHMTLQDSKYIITIVYKTFDGTAEAQFSCPGVVPSTSQVCNLPSEQRLPCGLGSVSQPQCLSMGCCFSKHPPACYYPMDECTADRHFVFSVPASLTEPSLSPALLVAGGNSSCRSHKVTSDYALFKIPMDGCGARRMQVGKTVIYMLEVNNVVNSISLNYGTITRDSPIRLLVECRFLPGNSLTVSYLVKTPTLGPAIQTQGAFGVQLRIAKDPQYKSYHPQYHQPLQMLLGKPLYLEVRLLNSPDPSLVLLVHYCVAYPRSGKAVWVLLYNGCPNPLDPEPQQVIVSDPLVPSRAQVRRFTISTFQFLPDGEFKDPNEEIYFMCSTEICSPRDSPCVEGCFGQ